MGGRRWRAVGMGTTVGGILAATVLGIAPMTAAAEAAPAVVMPVTFQNSMWQWFQASGLTDAQLKKFAPHFPKPVLTKDPRADMRAYDLALERWTKLYPVEYEAFVNAPALTALNPYYRGYVQVYHAPRFIGRPVDLERPERPARDATPQQLLDWELTLQNWLFVFQPGEFERQYGPVPRFPSGLDPETYRSLERYRAEHGHYPQDETQSR